MDEYIFKGSNSAIFVWLSALKGKNSPLLDQTLSFKSRPHLEGFFVQGTQQEVISVVPLCKTAENMDMFLNNLLVEMVQYASSTSLESFIL